MGGGYSIRGGGFNNRGKGLFILVQQDPSVFHLFWVREHAILPPQISSFKLALFMGSLQRHRTSSCGIGRESRVNDPVPGSFKTHSMVPKMWFHPSTILNLLWMATRNPAPVDRW